MKTQFKCVSDKYLGDGAVKDGTLKLIMNPGDIIEINTEKCTIKNITTGNTARQRNQDMIRGNKKKGISSVVERLNASLHYEEIEATEETVKRGPGRPAGTTNKGG